MAPYQGLLGGLNFPNHIYLAFAFSGLQNILLVFWFSSRSKRKRASASDYVAADAAIRLDFHNGWHILWVDPSQAFRRDRGKQQKPDNHGHTQAGLGQDARDQRRAFWGA